MKKVRSTRIRIIPALSLVLLAASCTIFHLKFTTRARVRVGGLHFEAPQNRAANHGNLQSTHLVSHNTPTAAPSRHASRATAVSHSTPALLQSTPQSSPAAAAKIDSKTGLPEIDKERARHETLQGWREWPVFAVGQHDHDFPAPVQMIRRALFEAGGAKIEGEISASSEGLRRIQGVHRRDADVVMSFAAGYSVESHHTFVGSLKRTGFVGDVILLIGKDGKGHNGVKEYLRTVSAPQFNVIVYEDHFSVKHAPVAAKFQVNVSKYQVSGLYALRTALGKEEQVLIDPRNRRGLAMIRFEVYWLWIRQYGPEARVLLIDFRDVVFQKSPFATSAYPPRHHASDMLRDTVKDSFDHHAESAEGNVPNGMPNWSDVEERAGRGYVDFFEETPTILHQRVDWIWMRRCWNPMHLYELRKLHPGRDIYVVNSGCTMGDQVGIETYLRGMVNIGDTTNCSLHGQDQSFHEHILYSNALGRQKNITSIRSRVNQHTFAVQLGSKDTQVNASHSTSAKTASITVFNKDGSVPCIVHQYDRHAYLSNMFQKMYGQA